jgi:hypothetical protein
LITILDHTGHLSCIGLRCSLYKTIWEQWKLTIVHRPIDLPNLEFADEIWEGERVGLRYFISHMEPHSWVLHAATGGRFDRDFLFGEGSLDEKPVTMVAFVREGWHEAKDYHFTVEMYPRSDAG